MNQDKMIEAIAKAIYCHRCDLPAPWDNAGDEWESVWSELRMEAESQATAVLELMRPKRLVWNDSKLFKACYSGPYTVQHEHSGDVHMWCAGIDGVIFSEGDSKAEMQAEAQAHADAAWLASLPLGELLGGKP
jgi:hypothetical protein